MAVVKLSRNNQQSTLLIKIFLIHRVAWNFCGEAHMLNKQYVHKGWTEGRNLLVCRREMVQICGVTNTLISKQQETILVHLENPGIYKQLRVLR